MDLLRLIVEASLFRNIKNLMKDQVYSCLDSPIICLGKVI